MEWELIQGVVIDRVRIHTGSCYRWSKDSYRNLLKMEWELILKYVYEILKTCSVILLSKKVFAPWFHGLQKKCLPRDFQKENNSAPRDFFDHKKSPPRDLRCAKKYPPRCILTGPVSDKFCQLPYFQIYFDLIYTLPLPLIHALRMHLVGCTRFFNK